MTRMAFLLAAFLFGAVAFAGEEPFPGEPWLKRLQGDQLSAEQLNQGVALALLAQADDLVTFDPNWGNFVELARTQGKLSEEQWRDYLFGAVRFHVKVARWVKRSTGLRIMIMQEITHAGMQGLPVQATGSRELELSGIELLPAAPGQRKPLNFAASGGSGAGRLVALTDERFSELRPGPQTLHYRYVIRFTEKGAPGAAGKLIGEHTLEGTLPWELLAEDAPVPWPGLQADPARRAAIAASFRVQPVLRDDRDKTLTQTVIQVDHPPADLAFEMALRAGGRTWPLGPAAWKRAEIGWWAYDADLPEDLTQVEVVLTPSAQAGAQLAATSGQRLMDLETIWDGPEIVLPGVPVRTQRITMTRRSLPTGAAALDEALREMNANDPDVQQLQRDRDLPAARARLEQRVKALPGDALLAGELAILLAAEGKAVPAMRCLVAARDHEPAPDLRQRLQRQQRRLCAHWLAGAAQEDAAAMSALAAAYEHGWGVGVDLAEAKRWYRFAAKAGQPEAMCRLASLYEHHAGATQHTEPADRWYAAEARTWYGKAAALGNEEATQWLTAHPL